MTMGEKILNMRKARGWSQEELAERIGVTRQAVSRWESNSAKPDADKIIAVCDLFGVSADYLLREQYAGELENGTVPVQIHTKSSKASLEPRQILGLTIIILGVLFLFIIFILSAINPVEHTVIHGDGSVMGYAGLLAYIRRHNLWWLLWMDATTICVGILMLLKKRIIDKDSIEDFKTMIDR